METLDIILGLELCFLFLWRGELDPDLPLDETRVHKLIIFWQ